jgi:transcriptional regulator with XRE-family HTH domain
MRVVDGRHLKILREGRGWTIAELARRAGQPEYVVEEMEDGRPTPQEAVSAVAKALDVSSAQLDRDAVGPLLEQLGRLLAPIPDDTPRTRNNLALSSITRDELPTQLRGPAEGRVRMRRSRPRRRRFYHGWKAAIIRMMRIGNC